MKIGDTPRIHGRHLWYSDFGEGKTYLAGLLHRYLVDVEHTKGLYMFDFDIGIQTLRSAGKFDDMEFDHYTGKGAFKKFNEKIASFAEDAQGYGGICLDSLTSLEKTVMTHIKKVLAPDVKRPMGGMVANQQDYGTLVQIIENILPFLQGMSLHMEVIMTAHMQERRNDETNILWNLPCVTGKKLPSKIGSYFNEVWHLSAALEGGVIKRTVQTATYDRFKCKTQIKDMPLSLPAEEALKLAVEAYSIGAVLDKDATIIQATEVVEDEIKGELLELNEPELPHEPTREEMMAEQK